MMYYHTDEINGYFKEGHVPAINTKRLIKERPAAMDLAVATIPN